MIPSYLYISLVSSKRIHTTISNNAHILQTLLDIFIPVLRILYLQRVSPDNIMNSLSPHSCPETSLKASWSANDSMLLLNTCISTSNIDMLHTFNLTCALIVKHLPAQSRGEVSMRLHTSAQPTNRNITNTPPIDAIGQSPPISEIWYAAPLASSADQRLWLNGYREPTPLSVGHRYNFTDCRLFRSQRAFSSYVLGKTGVWNHIITTWQ
jgi:hypothetical protein